MITVRPDAFVKVHYDAADLAAWAQASLERVPTIADDLVVEVNIDEMAATSRLAVVSLDPLVLHVDGGAVEDYREPRFAGELEANIAFTRLFVEVGDRLRAEFGAPDVDAEVTPAHKMAWDVNLYGRVARLGLRLHQPRFQYNFRNRHGFTDIADRMFEQLWSVDAPTWSRITELSDQATEVLQND